LTAAVVAEVLGLKVIVDNRLREVRRPWTSGNFNGAVASYLRGDSIEGWEPIEQVVARFEAALTSHSGEGPIGVVTHGTATACLLGTDEPADRAHFWSDLTMPDAWTVSDGGATRLYHLKV
jgi:broad specificity phosphatase PhoE